MKTGIECTLERQWAHVLGGMKVDAGAQMELFCLSQEGAMGREAAGDILAFIVSDARGPMQIQNRSSYVHSRIRDAWEKLNYGNYDYR